MMKYLVLVLVFFGAFVACKKDLTGGYTGGDNNNNHPVDSSLLPTFKAKIDGIQWIADDYIGCVRYTYSQTSSSFIYIVGTSLDGRQVALRVLDSSAKVYNLYDTSFNVGIYSDPFGKVYATDQASGRDSVGIVVITKIDTAKKLMSGTFKMTAYSGLNGTQKGFTEGVFTNVPYRFAIYVPPAKLTDTFSVKINDTLFNAYGITAVKSATDSLLRITGISTSVQMSVTLGLPDTTVAGTYQIRSASKYQGIYTNNNIAITANSGTITVLDNDTTAKRIRGNFNINAIHPTDSTKSAVLTQGFFSVKY